MLKQVNRKALARKRHLRIRKRMSGTVEYPRLAVYRSGKHIYCQLIDDVNGHTLASANTAEKTFKESKQSGANIAAARAIGELIAKRALDKGIESVVFDRGGHLYHGRIQTLADAAREAGLQF
jgi:large subunit ribosomal protein L18